MTKEELYAAQFFGTSNELRLFFGAVVLGAVLGAVYDILRALRMTLRHPAWAVALEDFLFVSAAGISFYSYCTQLCRGQLRLFVLSAMLIGFTLYLLTLGRIVSRSVAFALGIIGTVLRVLAKVLKKTAAVLFVVPFFQKPDMKFEEKPCPNEKADV